MNNFIKQLKSFRFKGTLVLFLIFVVLLVFVLIFEKKRPTKTEEELAGIQEKTFIAWEFKQEDAQKIEISYKEKNFEIVKEGDKWLAKKPREFEVKKEKIDNIFESVAKFEGEKKITEFDLADFGLDKPRLTAKFTLKDSQQFELLLGDENPENTKIYAKRADENYVFLADQSLKGDLEVSEDELEKKAEKKEK